MLKYPIGIQTFSNIIEEGYVYVDKTALVYKLANDGKYYFLSRPRRFGKSLLLTTLKSYFEGRKELFEGLAISKLEKDWTVHPVLHIDLNAELYDTPDSLRSIWNRYLSYFEETYGTGEPGQTLADRFIGVIRRAYEQT